MYRKNPDVDIVKNVLEATRQAYPDSKFVKSISAQYEESGGLSRKQLEGLYQKAVKVKGIPGKWLATVEAEIMKKPVRYKSAPPPPKPLYEKDEQSRLTIAMILEKYPNHKRVLFLRSKFNNNEPLSGSELAELERFKRLLLS